MHKFLISMALLSLSSTVFGASVTYSFSGIATNQTGVFADEPSAVSGWVRYDTNLLNSGPGNYQNFFRANTSGNESFKWSFSITNGSETFSVIDSTHTGNRLELLDLNGIDQWFMDIADPDYVPSTGIRIDLRDQASPFDMLFAGDNNLTGVPHGMDTVSLAAVTSQNNYVNAYSGPGVHIGLVEFDITSIGTVVPVPAAIWLFGSGLIGLIGLARRKKALSSY